MRRHNILIFSLICLFVLFRGESFSQASQATATGHIIAEVVSTFSATETSQLNFGRFAPGPQGGEIILTPESSISVLGSVYAGYGVHNAAAFEVTGDTDAAFTVSLPSEPVILTNISNSKTMRVENWNSIPAEGLGAGKLRNGSQIVYVGATLKVGSTDENPVGIYAGTYTISFDFN